MLCRIFPLFFYAVSASLIFGQIQITPLTGIEGETSDPTLSPDGTTLAFEWTKPDYSWGIYTRPFSGGPIQLRAGRNGRDGSPSLPRWSPDGHSIAFIRFYSHWDTHLAVLDLTANAERDLGNVCMDRPSWTPDSLYLVASRQGEPNDCRPTLYSVTTGRQVRTMAASGSSPTLSPDGRALAYADEKVLKLLRLTAEYRAVGAASTLAREPRAVSGIVWTPDGAKLIYQTWGDVPYLRRIKAQPGAKSEQIPGLNTELSISQFLPDGSALATETTSVDALWRADLRSSPVNLETITEHDCFGGGPGCSPDGRLRAFITLRTGMSQIWLANADGTNERPLVKSIPPFDEPDDGAPSLVGWSPDGQWIAFTVFAARGNADLRSRLFIIPSSGGEPRRLARAAYAINAPSWSGDSKSLYAAQGWDIEDRTHDLDSPLVRVEIADGRIVPLGANGIWPKESPDGRFVYFFTKPYPKLSRISLVDGTVERLWDREDLGWTTLSASTGSLYLFQNIKRGPTEIRTALVGFDPERRLLTRLAEVPFDPRNAHLSLDKHFLYFEQQEDAKRRVVLVRGLN